MLAGIGASYLYIQGIAAIAGTDDDGLAGERPKGFEDGAAKLLQGGNVLGWDDVCNAVLLGYG